MKSRLQADININTPILNTAKKKKAHLVFLRMILK